MTQLPTAVLGVLIISSAVLLAVAGAALTQRRVPLEVRNAHTVPLSLINGGLNVMFGVIVGFTSFIVLSQYRVAQQTVQSEAGDLEEIYKLAESLPQPKREHIQGLVASYIRVVVDEGWPLMRRGVWSPRADALVDELRKSIQEGYKTSTGAEQQFFAEELSVMDDLDKDREVRLLALRQHLPAILWFALVVLATTTIGFSYLLGMESRRLHLLSVAALTTSIVLVLFTIFVLDRPFGTDFQVGPQPFDLVLHELRVKDAQ